MSSSAEYKHKRVFMQMQHLWDELNDIDWVT